MILLSYSNIACDLELSKRAVVRIEPLLEHPDLTPLNRLWCHLRLGYYYYLVGQYRRGLDALDRVTSIKETHGLQGLGGTVLLLAAYQMVSHIMVGDLRSARKCLSHMLEAVDPARPTDLDNVIHGTAHVEGAAGNYRIVAESGARKSEQGAVTGMLYLEVLGAQAEATGWAVLGEAARLQNALSHLRRVVAGTCFAFFECDARLLETYAELVHGDPKRGRSLLTDAIAFARATRFQYPQMARSSMVPGVVLAEALREGVEADYVRDTIRRLHIKPPAEAPEAWPWPVKIFTLGRFEVWYNDQKLEFTGKAPRRVLAVLKGIVAGGGDPISIAHLMDALWPDEEGDAARKAFDVTLVRLRRLLGARMR
jgi:tetratricopeptide (TPR) repeat protein